ncbi:AfsR/SARP family transcriptional regulator [Kitasatospora cathayae]|uniref:Tetratricopeptide repeat protein n=1 Tax=Kitasatospora cathayae TaxID=3004092 RepID=A0ABY7QBI7_9ACTN|nr:tetratricopeptide repeat protein [Kitasatospora sp. HUAS 3-15]WBP90012.1 tetratricopeptide repeat protein [Kitasatospora sp. HUAS 3-15]
MRFRILGPLEVRANHRKVLPAGVRQHLVLALLLLKSNQNVPLSELVDAVWDDPPRTAEKQIRNAVSLLRGRLRSAGIVNLPTAVGANGYRFELPDDQLDLTVFTNTLATARRRAAEGRPDEAIAEFRASLGLWRGPALAGLNTSALQPYTSRLEEQRLTALEDCLDLELAQGKHQSVVPELIDWLGAHPLRERLAGQLMLALYLSGRQSQALSVYKSTRRRLADALGLEPVPELRELRQRILTNDGTLGRPRTFALAPRAPHSLPKDISHFTGRERELRTLIDEVAAGRRRSEPNDVVLAAIDGMPGVGKTSLAVHLAHRMTERYPDAQLYLDLHAHSRDHTPLDPGTALEKLLRSVDVTGTDLPEDVEERAALWRTSLAGLRAVLVLDNAASTAQIRPLLPGTTDCLTLVTSRDRLTDLDATAVLSLEPLAPAGARRLLTRILGERRVAVEPKSVGELLRLCGNLPLAIQIAAARLRHRPAWTIAHLTAQLRGPRRGLTELRTAETSLAAVFDLSYRKLDPSHQHLFRLLGVVPGTEFDADAAAAVAGIPRPVADRLLERLLDAHLLEQPSEERYRLHPLLQAYAVQLAAAEVPGAEWEEALTRLLDHYRHTAAAAMDLLAPHWRSDRAPATPPCQVLAPPGGHERAAEWLEAEWPTLLTAAEAAQRSRPGHSADIFRILRHFLHLRGQHTEALSLHTGAVELARDTADRELESLARYGLGVANQRLGRYETALTHFRQALDVARDVGDHVTHGRSLSNIGLVLHRLGHYESALTHFGQALALARDTGTPAAECHALSGLGLVHERLGRYRTALTHLGQALAIAQRIDDRDIQGYVLGNLGRVQGSSGQYQQATESLRRALATARDTGSRDLEGHALCGLAVVHERLGDHGTALAHLRLALELARDTGTRDLEGQALCGLAVVHERLGEHGTALAHAHLALELARDTGTRDLEGHALCALGAVRARLGDHDLALTHLQLALELARDTGTRDLEGQALNSLGELSLARGRPAEAAELHGRALLIAQEIGNHHRQDQARRGLDAVRHALGRPDAAA